MQCMDNIGSQHYVAKQEQGGKRKRGQEGWVSGLLEKTARTVQTATLSSGKAMTAAYANAAHELVTAA